MFCNVVQGGSGVGVGDFSEMGPLDSQLRPRPYAWTEKADLIFVVTIIAPSSFFHFFSSKIPILEWYNR